MTIEKKCLEVCSELLSAVNPKGPGFAVGCYSDGDILFAGSAGLANIEFEEEIRPSTPFHIASISKQFTALAIGLLESDGILSFDSQLGDFFPELQCGKEITLLQVIHHISGLRDQWGLLDLGGWRHEDLKTDQDVLRLALRQTALNFPSGERFQYINTGYTLLGQIVKVLTGFSLREFCANSIFKPLDMLDTHFHDDFTEIIPGKANAYSVDKAGKLKINIPAYSTVGPTGVFSTIEDFLQWERNFLDAKVGSPELHQRMRTPGVLSNGQSTGYGFGLAVGTHRGVSTIQHAGGDAGYRSHFLRFPEYRFAVAIFSNSPEFGAGQIAKRVADRCLFDSDGRDFPRAQHSPVQSSRATGVYLPDLEDFVRYCGIYEEPLGGEKAEFLFNNGKFFLESMDGTQYELLPIDENALAFVDLDAICSFDSNEESESKDKKKQFRMRTFFGGTETALLEYSHAAQDSSPKVLPREYRGRYFSSELDLMYDVDWVDDQLVLIRGKKGAGELRSICKDEFSARGGLLVRFARENGEVVKMFVSTERVWNIRFDKVQA